MSLYAKVISWDLGQLSAIFCLKSGIYSTLKFGNFFNKINSNFLGVMEKDAKLYTLLESLFDFVSRSLN